MVPDDIVSYHKWRNDHQVMVSTNPALDNYSFDQTESFVEQVILNNHSTKSYMIIERKHNQPIGITSLANLDFKNRNAELIIDIGEKEFWGKGYASEALKMLLNYAFNELNLHRLYLQVFAFNEKAIRLYQRLGFQQEGVSRQALFRKGSWHDILQMGLLQSEYNHFN
nr:GNAT family protein [Amphibacillus sediminis]